MSTTPASAPGPSGDSGPSVDPGQSVESAEPIPTPRTTPLAILAIIAVFFAPLAAIILGHLALAQTKRTGEPGHRLALVATVLGYVFTALVIIVLVLVAIVPLIFHAESPNYTNA